jgi:predicted outer membrane repeat protein
MMSLALGLASPRLANANIIVVTIGTDFDLLGGCSLRGAIANHNGRNKTDFRCDEGSANDQIIFNLAFADNRIVSGSPLPEINGTLTIGSPVGGRQKNNCVQVEGAAYLSIGSGANVTLRGVGFDANGSFQRSVIENNGGNLNIQAAPNGPCKYSNEKLGPPVVSGGILVNRFNGSTTIQGANFVDSSANPSGGQSSKGGAINLDSGTVTIADTITGQQTNFTNDTADRGGAIYVNTGATLNIASNNFLFSNNRAGIDGAAIYSTGGKVNIMRGSSNLSSVSFANNQAAYGGAIYSANGGKLSVDGVQFGSNSAGNAGGAVVVSNVTPNPNPAAITNSYFRQNSAGKGASIWVTNGSTLTVSGDTFVRDKGGIYADSLSTLGVINSTFLGSTPSPEGITVASGSGNVTFSTIVLASLTGPGPTDFNLSSSLLREVTCSNVLDDHNNLQQQSVGCPGTSETNLGLSFPFLAANGGPTPTIALVAGSPAIKAIPIGDCVDLSGTNKLTIDQRIFGRPASPGVCSTGAYEFGATASGPGIGGLPPGTQF